MRHVFPLVLAIAVCAPAAAAGPAAGEQEVTLRAVWSDTDFGSRDGVDFGSSETTDLSLSYGWLLTDRHEAGVVCGYVKQDSDGGSLFADESSDGTRFGGFYTYNFSGRGPTTPYLSAVVGLLGGDLGDVYDFQYGAEAGVKIYPFEHAGVSIGLTWSKLRADADGLPDADSLDLGVGFVIKY